MLGPVLEGRSEGERNKISLINPKAKSNYTVTYLWVPVRVENDDRIRGGQINAQATCSSGKQKTEILRTFRIEMIQRLLSQLTSNGTV